MPQTNKLSFKIPDPQKIKEGKKKQALAICFSKCGYNALNVKNICQIPLKLNTAKNIALAV